MVIYADFEDKFRTLFGAHFIHTKYRFEAQEFRSPMLQKSP